MIKAQNPKPKAQNVLNLRPWLGDCLLLLVTVLPAIQPLLRGTLPWSADGLLHFHRLAQLYRALRHGVLFPRWAPDMGFGFGFPLFNYYAPMSYYLAVPLHLAGLSSQDALLAIFALAPLVGCVGTYLWGRDLFGRRAGLVAAIAFAYAPYNLYNVMHRGALAEAWGLAWLPFVLWGLRLLAARGHRAGLVLTSLSYAAVLLTHNVLALISTPLLILYAMVLWGQHGQGFRRALLLGGALALGLGLAAFFWMPAFFEKEYVQIHQLYGPADLDYHNNFTDLARLLAPPQTVDPALINSPVPLSFGWPQLILALFALFNLPRSSDREARLHLALLALGLLTLTAMMLPCSVGVWDSLPLLRFVQFPWRFLGPAGLFLAVLSGTGAARLPGPDWVRLPLALALMAIFTLTWLFPHFYPPQPEPTPLDLIAFEQETGALGTTSAGDYLPIWVQRLPPADSLVPAYKEASPDFIIPRLDPAHLPAGAQVMEARYGLTEASLTLNTPSAFTAIFNWYFFPGWLGWLDGRPAELRPVGEHGLIGTEVPPGRHRLTVRLGDTPLRHWACLISVLSIIVMSVTLSLWHRVRRTRDSEHEDGVPPSSPSKDKEMIRPTAWAFCAAAALVLLALKATYLDHYDTIFRHSRFDGQSVAGIQVELEVNFDDQLILMGYDLSSSQGRPPLKEGEGGKEIVRADGVLELTLYWRALRPLDTDYSIAAHLTDDQGRRYGQKDSQHPAGYPTSRWQMDTYARDLHRLTIWPGTPPGEYDLLVSVYDVKTGRSLDVRNASGTPVGTTVRLASVQVLPPSRPPDPDSIEVARRLQADLGGGLLLLGFDPPPTEVNAGDHLPFTLYWHATAAPPYDYTSHLSLIAPDGTPLAEERAPPGRASYPTSAWRAGDIVRDGRSFLIPAATPAGNYTLSLELLDAAGEPVGPAASLLDVTVRAPERSFDLPPLQYPLSATLDGQATLLGYDLTLPLQEAPSLPREGEAGEITPGQPFTLTLYWRAEATADVSYTVFAHLLGEAERIYAQSDQVPAGGTRPTTGWLPGEIIQDIHSLTVAPDAPPGQYVLEVGLYDPTTGERLHVLDEQGTDIGDRILLPTPIQVK